ncbi:hypothetical protein CEXT_169161 [Caerostris extrusa]|uniref:Uncharacterized protein n=1 Tax=Caerostris extrusa TaxID=172846 RepID=A0AAV4VM24_CAEEX|nr:hypothetical protein CEXT_169161 [Caerostris extrusa]
MPKVTLTPLWVTCITPLPSPTHFISLSFQPTTEKKKEHLLAENSSVHWVSVSLPFEKWVGNSVSSSRSPELERQRKFFFLRKHVMEYHSARAKKKKIGELHHYAGAMRNRVAGGRGDGEKAKVGHLLSARNG